MKRIKILITKMPNRKSNFDLMRTLKVKLIQNLILKFKNKINCELRFNLNKLTKIILKIII